MQRQLVFLVASLVFFGISCTSAANWAVLVAGSNGWYNYRHQADVCHSYQVLHDHGIPDSNIIVFMYDDIAQNTQNPTKGVIINHPNGKDVYHGVPHDYNGKDVTPTNFLNVLLGNKAAMQGIGSGKVLESGPDDNVFIFYTDHGAVGLVAFPTGVLYAKDLNTTIAKMHSQNMYKQMVIYIESCESGSMLEHLLPNNINIYATTASNAEESSYACYYDAKRETYLGDVYSVVWMEDSDAEDVTKESLYQQYLVDKKKTNTSHVMQYGDLSLGKAHMVSEFQGAGKQSAKPPRNFLKNSYNDLLRRDAVPTEDVRLAIVSHRLASAEENSIEKENLQRELVQLINDRGVIRDRMQTIASTALSMNRGDYFEMVTEKRMKLTQHDCYKSVTQRVQEKCFDLQNEFVLNKLYIMANLCEIGLFDFTINQAVDEVCRERVHFDY
jgi:legumain